MSQREKEDQMLSLVRIAAQAELTCDRWGKGNSVFNALSKLNEMLIEHNDRFGEHDPLDASRFTLSRTCDWAPEQYDVYLEGLRVGYYRLRAGVFTAQAYDHSGPEVYQFAWEGDRYKGGFDSETERKEIMALANQALVEYLRTNGVTNGVNHG
jgi:hypothetical protein